MKKFIETPPVARLASPAAKKISIAKNE